MRRVQREEILSLGDYERERESIRRRVMEIKAARRVHLGEHLTFLFENPDTIRYQVQEMLRIEGLSEEREVLHELSTYNEILGEEGELPCTLMIEIDDPLQRDILLRRWLELPRHLFVRLEDGRKPRPAFDERQVGEDRLSSVQYLRFPVGGQVPLAVGTDFPGLEIEADLTPETRSALAEDLEG